METETETETDTPAGVAPAPTCTLIPAGTGGLQSGRQHQSYFEGISSRSAGSRAICMHLVLHPARGADGGAPARRARDGHLRP